MPTAVSLFSGCGGSDAGLIAAGFNILMANDILRYARDTYLTNLPETDYRLQDIREIKSFPNSDLLVGCYPCQGFSQGGAREANRAINYLYREFIRALRAIKPKAFIVENVSGMQRADFQHLLNAQITQFRLSGYRVEWKLINTKDYGIAQERKRIIIVGIRSDFNIRYVFPEPTHGPYGAIPYVTISDVISDLQEWPEGEFCDDEFHWYYLSRDRYCGWSEQSKTIVSNMRHMPLHPISPRLIRIMADKWVFESDAPARRFSYREAARLQGFPRNFKLPDTDYSSLKMRYKIVGNAVPPPLVKVIANALPDIW